MEVEVELEAQEPTRYHRAGVRTMEVKLSRDHRARKLMMGMGVAVEVEVEAQH
jgi:hypothetical protein